MSVGGDVTWTRSTHCGPSGGCVEVALDDGWVLVRDSKLGEGSPVQDWTPNEWCDLLAAIKSDSSCRTGVYVQPSGGVLLGQMLHLDLLRFDQDEWSAFSNGVKAGEFDLYRLLPGFKTSSGVGERSGVGDAPAAAATGAGGGAVLPVPVAAQDVPAGRADVEEADRSGLKPPSDSARRAAREAVLARFRAARICNGPKAEPGSYVAVVLSGCADAAVDAFLEAVIREAAAPLARS